MIVCVNEWHGTRPGQTCPECPGTGRLYPETPTSAEYRVVVTPGYVSVERVGGGTSRAFPNDSKLGTDLANSLYQLTR